MTKNIGAYIEEVSTSYWGAPTVRNRRELRWGNHGSKSVDLQKGTWFDHEAKEGGGVVDLVRREEGATIGNNIASILQRKFGIDRQVQEGLAPRNYLSKIFDYFDEDGVLRYQVQRFEPKTFRQRRPDDKGGWINNMEGVEALPYALPSLLLNKNRAIYIVEGEKCADRLIREGKLATTNHGGANNWKPEINKWFKDRLVVVIPDNDEAGRKHADRVCHNLVGIAAEIRRIDLPGLKEKGDIVDWLDSGNNVEDLRELVEAAAPLEAVDEPDEIEPEAPANVFETYSIVQIRGLPPVEWTIDGVIPQNSFSVMYGEPGAGKSFLALDMALSVAHNQSWHGRAVWGGAVLYIAGEGVGGLGKRIKAWQAYHGVLCDAPLFVLPTAVRMREDDEVEKLMRTIDGLGVNFSCVFIDTVARALLGGDENSATDMGMFVNACDAIKNHTKAAVIGIHHSGKDVARGMRGSTALLGAVDASVRVSRSDNALSMKMEKQKDAEPIEDLAFDMQKIQIIGDSSIVLEKSESAVQFRPRLSGAQRIALEALRQAMIDEGKQSVTIKQFHDAHARLAPDDSASRSKARGRLQEMGVIGISGGMVTEIREKTPDT
jgi:hypothetical protein